MDSIRASVPAASLEVVRVLHLSMGALLPTDLVYQPEPSIVTSAPPGAANAAGALRTVSDITGGCGSMRSW